MQLLMPEPRVVYLSANFEGRCVAVAIVGIFTHVNMYVESGPLLHLASSWFYVALDCDQAPDCDRMIYF